MTLFYEIGITPTCFFCLGVRNTVEYSEILSAEAYAQRAA